MSTECCSGHALLDRCRDEIAAACGRHSVTRLDAFGSVLRDDFTTGSDVDLLVEFASVETSGFEHPYWSLAEELETILGHRVDLVMVSAVTNPYLVEELARSRQVLYAG